MKRKICVVIAIVLLVLSLFSASVVMAETLKYIPSPQEISQGFYYTSIKPNYQWILDDLQKDCGVRPIYGETVDFHDRTREPIDGIIIIAEFSNIRDTKKCYSHVSSELPECEGHIIEIDSFGDESYSVIYNPEWNERMTVFRNDRFIAIIMTMIGANDFTTDILPKIIDEKLEQIKVPTPTPTPSIPAFQIITAIATLLAVAYLLRIRCK